MSAPRAKVIALSLVLILICGIPLFLLSVDPLQAEPVARQAGSGDFVVTGTQNIVSKTYETIWIKGGTLTIKSSSVGVVVEDSVNITDGGTLLMEKGSKLRIQNGTFDGSGAERVEIMGDLEVTNDVIDVEGANEGESSSIIIETSGNKPIKIGDGKKEAYPKITCTGGKGNDALTTGTGFDGGDASIVIRTTKKTNIEIWGLDLRVEGGAGGESGPDRGHTGGAGGKASLEIDSGKDLEIEESKFLGKGGSGGPGLDSGRSGYGGNIQEFYFKAVEDINIEATHFESEGGLSDTGAGASKIKFEGASLMIDDLNTANTKAGPLSFIISDAIDIKAKKGAELHEVVADPAKVQALDSRTDIEFYWWLQVILQDEVDTPIEAAKVTIQDETGGTVMDGVTLSSGSIWFELLARKKTDDTYDIRRFGITAEFYEQIAQRTDVTLKENTVVVLVMDLLDLSFTNLWVAGSTRWGEGGPPNLRGATVGGETTINGTSGAPTDISPGIQFVKLKIQLDVELDVPWMDVIQTQSGSWDNWYFMWDTTNSLEYQDLGKYIITAWTGDGLFFTYVNITVTIDQSTVNHPPQITAITNPPNNYYIEDTSANHSTTIKGSAYDEDWNTAALAAGRAIELISVNIKLIPVGGTPELVETFSATIIEGKQGRINWTIRWDTREVKQGDYVFKNGKYTIEVRARDNGGSYSIGSGVKQVFVTLKHLVNPTSDITYISSSKESLIYKVDQTPETDEGSDRKSQVEATDKQIIAYVPNDEDDKNRGVITLSFDAGSITTADGRIIGSFDDDGERKNTIGTALEDWDQDLSYFWRFKFGNTEVSSDDLDGDGGNGWSNTPSISYKLEIDIEDWEKEKRNTYTVILTVQDQDGLTREDSNQIILQYIPPEYRSGPLTFLGLNLDLRNTVVVLTILIILAVINSIGIVMMLSVKRKQQRLRERRESAIKSLIDKRKQRDALKQQQIDSAVTSEATYRSLGVAEPDVELLPSGGAQPGFSMQAPAQTGGFQPGAQQTFPAQTQPMLPPATQPVMQPVQTTQPVMQPVQTTQPVAPQQTMQPVQKSPPPALPPTTQPTQTMQPVGTMQPVQGQQTTQPVKQF